MSEHTPIPWAVRDDIDDEMVEALRLVRDWAEHANAICEPEDEAMLSTVLAALAKAEA